MLTMIAQIEGLLISIEQSTANVRVPGSAGGEAGGLVYEVLLPAFLAARLQPVIGSFVRLHTLHYLESQNQGAVMLPRLAGFQTRQDRQFYELFCTCKGIGNRRALRAMALPVEQIAGAIADRDAAVLQSLPEIGRKMAESIITALRDKVSPYLGLDVPASTAMAAAGGKKGKKTSAGSGGAAVGTASGAGTGSVAREALEALMQLGENRTDAIQWIDRAFLAAEEEGIKSPDAQRLISIVYQIKGGG